MHVGEQHVQALCVVIVIKDWLPIGVVLGANLARQVNQDEPRCVEFIRYLLKVLYLIVEGVIEVEEDYISRKLGVVPDAALCPRDPRRWFLRCSLLTTSRSNLQVHNRCVLIDQENFRTMLP